MGDQFKESPDQQLIDAIQEKRIHQCISLYLCLSYLYYKHDISVVFDSNFDALCKFLLAEFKQVKDSKHIHKHLVLEENLEAGTFLYSDDLPWRLIFGARSYAKNNGHDVLPPEFWTNRIVGGESCNFITLHDQLGYHTDDKGNSIYG